MDYSDEEIEKEEDWFSEDSIDKNTESQDGAGQKDNLKDNADEAKEKSKSVKRKRAVTSSTRAKLNINTLMGPNGLEALKKSFEKFEFKGNNHEKEDLTKIIQVLQHWMCYQLFPKCTFESNMAKLEILGNKKNIQTLMKRFRLGIDNWGEQKPNNVERNEIYQGVSNNENHSDNNFNSFLEEQIACVNSDNDLSMDEEPQHKEVGNITTPIKPLQSQTEVTLTPEQLERIAINRRLAEERKLKRLMNEKSDQDSTIVVEGQT